MKTSRKNAAKKGICVGFGTAVTYGNFIVRVVVLHCTCNVKSKKEHFEPVRENIEGFVY